MVGPDKHDSGGRGSRLRLADYLDSAGNIVLPSGASVVTFLGRYIADIGDAIAYRYLDYTHHTDGRAIELTWAELGIRLRAIGARLQQVTAPGDRVAILAPQGIDYVVGFFAAISAGNIAVPLFAPCRAAGGRESSRSTKSPTPWAPRSRRCTPTPTTSPTCSTRRGRRAPRSVWRSPTEPSAPTCCRWSSRPAWTLIPAVSAGCRSTTTW